VEFVKNTCKTWRVGAINITLSVSNGKQKKMCHVIRSLRFPKKATYQISTAVERISLIPH